MNWLRFRDVCYPGFLHAALWALVVVLLAVASRSLSPLSDRVFVYLIMGCMMFSIGTYLATWQHVPVLAGITVRQDSLPSRHFLWGLFLAIAAISPLYLERAIALARAGPSANLFVNLRGSLTWQPTAAEGYGVLKYIVPAASFVAACVGLRCLAGMVRKERVFLTLAVLLALGLAFLATGRTFVILLFLPILGIALILRRIRPAAALAVVLCGGVAVFVSMGLLRGDTATTGHLSSSSIVTRSIKSLSQYSLGPSAAFDQLLQSQMPLELGRNSLRFFYVALFPLGGSTPVPQIQPYVFVPYPVNVYTVYQPYFQDYGVLGVLLAQLLFGLWHGFLYRRATAAHPSAAYVLLYAFFLFPLAMQFFADAYMTSLSMWVQYGILVFLGTTLLASRGVRGALLPARAGPWDHPRGRP